MEGGKVLDMVKNFKEFSNVEQIEKYSSGGGMLVFYLEFMNKDKKESFYFL